jgi:hypothetical protein
MLIALTLALQSSPPLLQDPAFLAAHEEWTACTNRFVDAGSGSERRAEALADAAMAACGADRDAVREAVIAFSGEAEGRAQLAVLLNASREGLTGRVNERRRRASAAGVDRLIEAWVGCLLRQASAATAETPETQVVEASFEACIAAQEELRWAARAHGTASQWNEFLRLARESNRDALLAHLRERRARPNPPR